MGASRRFGFRRTATICAVAIFSLVLSHGTASAGLDNASSVTDARGNRIEVLQADTVIRTVPPLDSSPLSVEFFHDGVASVNITGPDAAEFENTRLTVGYQIGYPIALAGAAVVLNTPNLDWEVGTENAIILGLVPEFGLGLEAGTFGALGGSIIPSQELAIELEPGGITTVPILENQEFDGPIASVRLAGLHGHVSGAIGPVTIRPYAMATTSNGDTVVTYGVPQRLS